MKYRTLSIITASIFLLAMSMLPVFADDDMGHDIVINSDSAMVMNCTRSEARTGANWADGSYGGNGGGGGAIENNGGEDVEESMTGNGGMGGNASDGGLIVSGDGTSEALTDNTVNNRLTVIDRCACEEDDCECGLDIVFNRGEAMVMSGTDSEAKTGKNDAEGSYAGAGGDGGAIENNGGEDVEGSTTGIGGDGGMGALGGQVLSGVSYSRSDSINVINRSVTRIFR